MAAVVLVDGYNVVLCDPELASKAQEELGRARHALLALISGAGVNARVWFDARFPGSLEADDARQERVGRALGLFAHGRSADDELRREVARAGRGVVLVTSDIELADWARGSGAVIVPSDEFLARLRSRRGGGDKSKAGAEGVDVDDWAEWFSFSPEDLGD